jgi:exonuclease III
MDTYNIIHNRNPYSRKKIDEIIEAFELLDPWRTRYPDERKYTWRQSSPIKQSRLDYFLVSEDLYSLMKYTKIIPGYKTDHSAIIFKVNTFCNIILNSEGSFVL